MAHPEGRAIVPDRLNKLIQGHRKRGCGRWGDGGISGSRHREGVCAGRRSGVALGGRRGTAASGQAAQRRHQHQNAQHRPPTAPPRWNPQEEQKGQRRAAARAKQVKHAAALAGQPRIDERSGCR